MNITNTDTKIVSFKLEFFSPYSTYLPGLRLFSFLFPLSSPNDPSDFVQYTKALTDFVEYTKSVSATKSVSMAYLWPLTVHSVRSDPAGIIDRHAHFLFPFP